MQFFAWMMDSVDGISNDDELVVILFDGNDRLIATSQAQVHRLKPA